GLGCLVASGLEVPLEYVDHVRLVFDDQNAFLGHVPLLLALRNTYE
ncbi:MAG: hypothetical protein ACI9MC_001414, partial [Kiritimatiellia bacterium]